MTMIRPGIVDSLYYPCTSTHIAFGESASSHVRGYSATNSAVTTFADGPAWSLAFPPRKAALERDLIELHHAELGPYQVKR
jgi:hypothetical protein